MGFRQERDLVVRNRLVLLLVGVTLSSFTGANGYTFIKTGWPVAETCVTAESSPTSVPRAAPGLAKSTTHVDFNRVTWAVSPGIGLTSYPFTGCMLFFR